MGKGAAEQNVHTPRPASVPASESRATKSPAPTAEKRFGADESCSSAGDDSRHSTSASATRFGTSPAHISRSQQQQQQQVGEAARPPAPAETSVSSSLSVSVAGTAGTGKALDSSAGAAGPQQQQQPDCIYSLTAMQQQQQAGGSLRCAPRLPQSQSSAGFQMAAGGAAQAADPVFFKSDSTNLFNCQHCTLPLNLATLLEHCPLFRIDCLPLFVPALSTKLTVRLISL